MNNNYALFMIKNENFTNLEFKKILLISNLYLLF